jgi:hypothetical protein
MNKLIALSVVAAFALGACASQPGPSQQKVFTNVYPYTPGQGTVTAVMPAPGQGSAAAGAGATAPIQRLEIRMDNGTVQYVDVPSKDFAKGTRVNLSQDKLIRKI